MQVCLGQGGRGEAFGQSCGNDSPNFHGDGLCKPGAKILITSAHFPVSSSAGLSRAHPLLRKPSPTSTAWRRMSAASWRVMACLGEIGADGSSSMKLRPKPRVSTRTRTHQGQMGETMSDPNAPRTKEFPTNMVSHLSECNI